MPNVTDRGHQTAAEQTLFCVLLVPEGGADPVEVRNPPCTLGYGTAS